MSLVTSPKRSALYQAINTRDDLRNVEVFATIDTIVICKMTTSSIYPNLTLQLFDIDRYMDSVIRSQY
jgi:predicted membrane channel-forming protein YqfA (hemolysin III family)